MGREGGRRAGAALVFLVPRLGCVRLGGTCTCGCRGPSKGARRAAHGNSSGCGAARLSAPARRGLCGMRLPAAGWWRRRCRTFMPTSSRMPTALPWHSHTSWSPRARSLSLQLAIRGAGRQGKREGRLAAACPRRALHVPQPTAAFTVCAAGVSFPAACQPRQAMKRSSRQPAQRRSPAARAAAGRT